MNPQLDSHDEPVEANFTNIAGLNKQPIKWLWPGRIPLGHLTLIAGDPGVGKSTIATDIAARTSANLPWPDAETSPQQFTSEHAILDGFPILPAQVVYLSAQEDLAATLLPRLEACGANTERIIATSDTPSIDDCLEQLSALLSHLSDCRLVVFDPLSAYLRQFESSRGQAARKTLEALTNLAAEHKIAILGITHKTRSQRGPDVTCLTTSIAIAASARSIWTINPDPRKPGRRLFLPAKTNLAFNANGLLFRVDPAAENPHVGQPIWNNTPITLDGIDNHGTSSSRSKLDPEIDEWLLAKLAHGPIPSGRLKQNAIADGFSWNTVRRAKARLSIESTLILDETDWTDKWNWQFPNQSQEQTPSKSTPNS